MKNSDLKDQYYAVLGEEENLPLCLYGIGWHRYQEDIDRENGFYIPQIIYSVKGIGEFSYNGETYEIGENTVIIIPARIPHSYHTKSEQWSTQWISFAGNFHKETLKSLNFDKVTIIKNPTEGLAVERWSEIYDIFTRNNPACNKLASSILYRFLIELSIINEKQVVSTSIQSNLQTVLNYIDEHYSEDLNIDDLSAIIDVSPQYLCMLFRKNLQLRPVQYITKKRIQKAKSLLKSGIKIADVANLVGIHDISYFCKIFKDQENMTPGQFVKQ